MQYSRFGNTGMQVSRYCLGTMTFPNQLEVAASSRIIDAAIDHGVNFIDTADSYGKSEEVLGTILDSTKREKLYLATKVFRRYCRNERVGRNSRVNIISSLERSLRLLKTDYVDLYQLHHPDPDTPIEETVTTLDTMVRQGKIRYIGVSNHYAWQMATMIAEQKALRAQPMVSLQANYDILDRQVEFETLHFCRDFNIALMCYSPLAGGLLSGKYTPGEPPPKGSRGQHDASIQRFLEDPAVQKILKRLQQIGDANALRMNQIAVLWLLYQDPVTSVILGGSKAEHFDQLYAVADRSLPDEVADEIGRLSQRQIHAPFRNQPMEDGPPLAEQW